MFKFNRKILLAVLSLALFFCAADASAQSNGNKSQKTGKPDCAQMSADDVVKAIYGRIRVKYADQLSHINVTFADGEAMLEGYATTQKVKKDIEKMVKKTSCVTRVTNRLGVGTQSNCGPGQVQCGDICIGEGKACNICRPPQPGPGCP